MSKSRPKNSVFPLPTSMYILSFVIVFLIALAIRLPFFTQIPAGLNRDEAGLGYNAFSLLKAGADEYGHRWPVSITSFGDEKLPGYVYLLIPFIAQFGLTIWSVRLPSLLAGLLLVLELGYLGKQIGERFQWTAKMTWLVSTLSMLFIAVSPWANHFSRVAYEAHVALALFVLGFIAYQAAIQQIELRSKQHSPWLERGMWFLTAVSWSATLLTYHSYHLFVPPMILAMLVIDWRKIFKADVIGLVSGVLIGCATIALLFHGGVIQANFIKDKGITPFQVTALERKYVLFRNLIPNGNSLYGKLLFNTPGEALVIFSQNYLSVFAADFFFVHGSGLGDHNPGGFSNLPPYMAPLLLFGVICLWHFKKKPTVQRLTIWIVLAAVPAALTINPHHEIRLSPIFPALTIIGAIGAVFIFQQLTKNWQRYAFIGMLSCLIVFSTFRSSLEYLFLIPNQIQSHEQYHLLARTLMKYQSLGSPVITNKQTSSQYIWYLFESKYDPAQYNQHVERYGTTDEGFIHVKRIDNIYFQNINWDDLTSWSERQKLYLVLAPRDFPDDKLQNPRIIHLEDIKDEHGQIVYQVWEWK